MSETVLREEIVSAMKVAMKAGDKFRRDTLRLISAAIKQREVDERIELSNQQVLEVLDKMAKQRRESITQFQAAQRNDLADKEIAELEIIQTYLPSALSETEIEQFIQAEIKSSGASSMKEMGKLMAALKSKLQGRADMKKVSGRIRALLNS
ncbi:MAG: GatB/YqeY domain-containing protein [Gammaproteobacteria bacterium]|nr:GatB/YqeY domain-containing protein [Gammaproteobacteria bacterium]